MSAAQNTTAARVQWTFEMRLALFVVHKCYDLTKQQRVRVLNNIFADHLRTTCNLPAGMSENDQVTENQWHRRHKNGVVRPSWRGIVGERDELQQTAMDVMEARVRLAVEELGLPGQVREEDGTAFGGGEEEVEFEDSEEERAVEEAVGKKGVRVVYRDGGEEREMGK